MARIIIEVPSIDAELYIESVVLPDLRNGMRSGHTDSNNNWRSEGLWDDDEE